PRRHTEPIERPVLVFFSSRAIARDDAGDMRPVAVLVGGIGQAAIMKKRWCAPEQIRVHRTGVAIIQNAIGDSQLYPSASVSEPLRVKGIGPTIAGHYLGGDFINELKVRSRFDPKHGVGARQAIDLVRVDAPAKNRAESQR